jgi:hypothetical protein
MFARAAVLQRVGRVYVHPDRTCYLLPLLDGELFRVVRDAALDFSWATHRDKVIGDSLSAHCCIRAYCLMQQPERLCALHSRHWVFPDTHFTGIYESVFLERANQVASEVLQPNIPVALFTGRQQHAMKAYVMSWLYNAQQLPQKKIEVLEKLLVIANVAHIARAV